MHITQFLNTVVLTNFIIYILIIIIKQFYNGLTLYLNIAVDVV